MFPHCLLTDDSESDSPKKQVPQAPTASAHAGTVRTSRGFDGSSIQHGMGGCVKKRTAHQRSDKCLKCKATNRSESYCRITMQHTEPCWSEALESQKSVEDAMPWKNEMLTRHPAHLAHSRARSHEQSHTHAHMHKRRHADTHSTCAQANFDRYLDSPSVHLVYKCEEAMAHRAEKWPTAHHLWKFDKLSHRISPSQILGKDPGGLERGLFPGPWVIPTSCSCNTCMPDIKKTVT